MSIVEDSLNTWAATATEAQLDLGPSLADLGGAEAVAAEARDLAVGPHFSTLLQALARPDTSVSGNVVLAFAAAVAEGFRSPYRAWVLAEAVDVLCSEPLLLNEFGQPTAPTLLRHAEDALGGTLSPAFAHPAIAGMLQLALSGRTNHRRLLALLTEIRGDEPADALERLPLLIGIAYDHYDDSGLIDVLHTLAGNDVLPASTRNDARYELALASMRAGLRASDRNDVVRQLRTAALQFRHVESAEEARLDARSYRLALDALFAFIDLEGQPTVAVRDRILASARGLDETVAQRSAWSSRRHQPRWLEARGHAEAAWHQLVATLRFAGTRLLEPSWLNASKVLADVLTVYQASRAVYAAPVEGDGLARIVSPTVEAAFIREMGLLHHLEQALGQDPELAQHPDARHLNANVKARRQALEAGASGEPPGKSEPGQQPWALLLGDYDPVLRQRMLRVIDEYERGYALTGNAMLDRQLAQLHAEMAQSPGWEEPARTYFSTLLTHVLRFLHGRFDAQADLLGDVTAYLGPAPAGKPWLEEHLQNDLLQYLTSRLDPPGSIRREEIDISSGRTDITYTPQVDMRFVIEAKRHSNKWTKDGLEQKYLAQTVNYTATGPPFCILLIGDHSNHAKGYTSLDDSVWSAWRSRSPTEIPRFIAIGVLPIGRPTPSSLTSQARLGNAQPRR
ncbi:hypothetical protein [Dactylosporangium sp. CA-139066]|uniref:hypothetical protein n=1 Tax=Dactylosporangium sp. CA-139066 TaxID=3239930 RepID=UPI003D92DEEB